MNNKEIMIALLEGFKICNPNWGCKYIRLKGVNIVTNTGEPVGLLLQRDISGETRIYLPTNYEYIPKV